MSTIVAGNLFSQFVYKKPKDRPVDFYCPEFQKILNTINDVLLKYGVQKLSFNSAKIIKSKYDIIQKYKCKSMWRVTSDTYPDLGILCNMQVNRELAAAIDSYFPQYLGEVIKINTYAYNTKASIVIMPGGLTENTFTKEDLKKYKIDPVVKDRLDRLEDRMYRRADDIRSKERRWEDFANADDYEPILPKLSLVKVCDLALLHSTEEFSIDPPEEPDYIGKIDGLSCTIEAKSTWDSFKYEETEEGKQNFAKYWESKVASLGSLHNANYILFLSKLTGEVIGLERLNPKNNWLAGKLVF